MMPHHLSMEIFKVNWKNNLKEMANFICFMILACICVLALGYVLRPDTVDDKSTDAINNFHNLPRDSIEVMIYGPSRSWAAVNPMTLYEQYGIGSYNYSCNWQHINTTEAFIADSFRTQSPKVACVEMGLVNNILSNQTLTGETYYTRYLSNLNPVKFKIIHDYYGNDIDRIAQYYFPLLAFHSNWRTNFGNSQLYSSRSDIDFMKTMG